MFDLTLNNSRKIDEVFICSEISYYLMGCFVEQVQARTIRFLVFLARIYMHEADQSSLVNAHLFLMTACSF